MRDVTQENWVFAANGFATVVVEYPDDPFGQIYATVSYHEDGRLALGLTVKHQWDELALQATCMTCHELTPTGRTVDRDNVRSVNRKGEFKCRKCGRRARIPELYAIYTGNIAPEDTISSGGTAGLTVVSEPQWLPAGVLPSALTAAELRRLADVVTAFRRGELTEEQFVRAVANSSPELRSRLQRSRAWATANWPVIAQLVLQILALILQINADAGVSQESLDKAIQSVEVPQNQLIEQQGELIEDQDQLIENQDRLLEQQQEFIELQRQLLAADTPKPAPGAQPPR